MAGAFPGLGHLLNWMGAANPGTNWWSREHKSEKNANKFRGKNKPEGWFGGERTRTENWCPTKPAVQRIWRKGAWQLLFIFCLYWGFLVLVVILSWLLYFVAWLNIFSPKIIGQDKRNLSCFSHFSTKGSWTQLLPWGRKQELWAHSHFQHFYPYKTFIFHITKLFLLKDPKKLAVSNTQPGVQGLYGWGDILVHNNNTKSLSKIVRGLELPVAISQ